MRYEITIDRDLLEHTSSREACLPLLVLDTLTGDTVRAAKLQCASATVIYGSPRQNGARVWVETDNPVYVDVTNS